MRRQKNKEKTRKKILKETENLRRQIKILQKSAAKLKLVQKKEKQYSATISFLGRTAIKFVEFPSNKDIYPFIGECLKELVPDSMVFINSFDEATGIICTRLALGIGAVSEKTLKLLGRHPVGMTFKISKEALLGLTSNKLNKVPGGLYGLGLGEIPKPVCRALEKLYRIKHIYAIGFTWRGQLYGNATFIIPEKKKIENKGVIEAFIKQASIALQRRQFEKSLKSSLKEKETLLKEIHHRVKNNLQIVSSLLNLQSRQLDNANHLRFFKDAQDRIRSIVLIHDKLYQSADLAHIYTSDYVDSLLQQLLNSFAIEPGAINLKTNIEKLPMNIDMAIPCGLIITELVSNSLKHAFGKLSKNKKPCIAVKISKDKTNHMKLIVSDNGAGFPENLDFRNTSTLGLQLVCTLVDQVGGSIKLSRREGTTFTITCHES